MADQLFFILVQGMTIELNSCSPQFHHAESPGKKETASESRLRDCATFLLGLAGLFSPARSYEKKHIHETRIHSFKIETTQQLGLAGWKGPMGHFTTLEKWRLPREISFPFSRSDKQTRMCEPYRAACREHFPLCAMKE